MIPYRAYPRMFGLLLVMSAIASLPVNRVEAIGVEQPGVVARSTEDRKAEADQLFNQGNQQYLTSQFTDALQSWEKALQIYRELKDRKSEGAALENLGLAYDALGDYSKAIEYHQQSLAIAREIKDRLGEGQALGSLGNAYLSLGDYGKAIEYHQQSLAIARKIKDRLGEGHSLGNLGNAYYRLGDYGKAIEYHQQSLAIAREIKDRLGEGTTLGNLGLAYHSLGDYGKAIEYHQQRLAIAREIKDRLGEGQSLGNLGLAYHFLGDYGKAIDYHQQRLAIAREIKDRLGEGTALGNLGNAYYRLGDYGKAIEYQQQWLEIAREIKDRLGEGSALGSLGNAYFSLGDYGKAIEYQQQSLAIARKIKDRLGEGLSLGNLGVALFDSGKLTDAESPLLDAIQVFESLRKDLSDTNKVSIADTQSNSYRTLQQVLVAQNKKDAALEIAERGRARAFLEQLAKRVQGTEQPTLSPIHIADIQKVAQAQNATLVEYSQVYDGQLFIWVVKPTGEVDFRKVDLNPLKQQHTTLEELVTNSRKGIGVSDRGDRANARIAFTPEDLQKRHEQQSRYLQQLHQLLIEPIADLLPTNPTDHIIFLPQGELFLVPFAALQDKSNQYLIQQHTIAIAPAIQVLQLTHQQRQTNQPITNNILVAGNPVMPQVKFPGADKPIDLPYLPGAEQEAIAVAKALNTTALIGDHATKKAIVQQMQTARIIHLATHGLLDDFKGLGVPGAIALAPDGTGQPNDGLLTSDDILDMKLKAELVVLSACNTGRGKITGDGVVGLSRSLITAGVPSVMVSLWSVPDAPTAALMTEFYRQIESNPDKAAALRQAMLKTIQTHPEPRDWAAFILIGEAK